MSCPCSRPAIHRVGDGAFCDECYQDGMQALTLSIAQTVLGTIRARLRRSIPDEQLFRHHTERVFQRALTFYRTDP